MKERLPGKVFFQDDDEYSTALAHYDSLQEQELHPRCVVFPTATADISVAINIPSEHGTEFAITGSGGTYDADAANINDGVTINLRKMNRVTVSEDRSIVPIGSGTRWHEVYERLESLRLTTVGGRVLGVGVAGLTLGGEFQSSLLWFG